MPQAAQVNLGFTPERYPPGVHMCHMFSDEVDRHSVIYPFTRAGLRENEDVHYFADALVTEMLERALDDRAASSLRREELSRLHITSVEDVYFPSGSFVPDEMLDYLAHLYQESRRDGASGCRATGEMSWVLRNVPGSDQIANYEAKINTLVATTPMTILCQYDTEQFDGYTLFNVLSVHPQMVVRGQIMRNPHYVEPEAIRSGAVELTQKNVLTRLYLFQIVITCLPDERRISEFAHCAFLEVPGVREVHFCLEGNVVPPDDRLEWVARECARSATKPNSFDLAGIERETGAAVFVLRTTARLFGVVVIDVEDADAFSPYHDVLVNIANAIALTLEARRGLGELHVWPERVASLERRLWRIAREFEGAGVLSSVTSEFNGPDPYLLPGVAELSPRQWEVLTRLLRSERVPRIAEELFLSQSTVRNHLADMFKKMGVHSQEELLDLFRTTKVS